MAVHLWIISNARYGGGGVPPVVYEFRKVLLDVLIERGRFIQPTEADAVVIYDWLDTFAELPDDVMAFKMTLFSVINDGPDIHESGSR